MSCPHLEPTLRKAAAVLTVSALLSVALTPLSAAAAGPPAVVALAAAAPTAPGTPRSVAAAPAPLGVRVTWTAPALNGGSAVTAYRLSSSVTGAASRIVEDVPADVREWIVDVAKPGLSVAVSVSAVNAVGASPAVAAPVRRSTAVGGLLRVLPRTARLMDSGTGLGTSKAPLAAGAARTLTVAGRGGVPPSGAASVWVNVVVTDATSATSVRVWPTGSPRPGTPSVVVPARDRVVAPVQLPLGADGSVQVENAAGSARVMVDVVAFTLTPAASGTSQDGKIGVVTPFLLADSRTGVGVPKAAVGAGRAVEIVARGLGGVPSSGVRAVVVNVTALGAAGVPTWLSASSGGVAAAGPTVGVRVGHNVTTRVAVRPSSAGRIRLLNSTGTTHVRVEVVGWVSDGTTATAASSAWLTTQLAQVRADTASGYQTPKAPLGAGKDVTLSVAGLAGVPAMTSQAPPSAVLARLLVTPTSPSVRATVTARQSGTALPPVWDVTTATGLATSNLVWVPLSPAGSLTIRNQSTSTGAVNLRLEIVGWTSGDVMLASKLKVLTAAEAAALMPAANGVFTVAAGKPVPAVGSVIVAGVTAQHPVGLLRRVTRITTNANGTRTVTARQAALVEAVRVGKATVRVPMVPPVAALPRTAGVTSQLFGGRLRHLAGTTTGVSAEINDNLTAGVTIGGSATASADFDLTIDIGWDGVTASAVASAEHSVDATITASAAASWKKEIELGTWKYRWFIFYIGAVPVVVEPSIGLTAFAEGELKAKATLHYQHAATGSAGMTWDHGLQKFSNFAYSPPSMTGEFEGEMSASVGLKVELGLTFYKTGTVKIGLKAHGDATMTAADCEIKLSAGLDLTLSVGLEVIGPNVKGTLSVPLKEWDLGGIAARDRCLAWTGLVRAEGQKVYRFEPNYDYYKAWGETVEASIQAQYAPPAFGSAYQRVTFSGSWYDKSWSTESPCYFVQSSQAATQTIDAAPALRLADGWQPRFDLFGAITGTRTSTTCDNSATFAENNQARFFADGWYESDLLKDWTPVPADSRTIDVTWSETIAQMCARNGICQSQQNYTNNFSGQQMVRMRLTRLPDDDNDGLPNVTDANPTTVDPL